MNAPDWGRDGLDWPNRTASCFVESGGLRWHVQRMGQGPVLLLLHGTGAANHSWRDVMPALAREFTVIAPDLPGHGFTAAAPTALRSLPGMASGVSRLLADLGVAPQAIVGHSAGAAISARMALDGAPGLQRLVWIAGALQPFAGVVGRVAAPMARLLARSALPRLAAWRAREGGAVQRLIDATGSRLDERGVAAYRTVLCHPSHVAGALALMGGWDLAPLSRALPRLRLPVLLLHGENDRTVPPSQSDEVAARLPLARVVRLPGLGHLAHEERPGAVVQHVREACRPG